MLLSLKLFGGFDLRVNDVPVDSFVSNKARALLAFLVVTNRPQPRPVLAELLWGDKPDDVANANLRMALSNLRKLVGPCLDITRSDVAIVKGCRYDVDVQQFQTRLNQVDLATLESNCTQLEEAMALYRGDFLEGLAVRDASSFEEWALRQRERYRQMAMQALYRLSMIHTDRGSYALAIDYTTRLLELEPWQEEGHRQMMLLLAVTGQRSAALAQYAACRRILLEELHVDPMPETNALLARIRAMPEQQRRAGTGTCDSLHPLRTPARARLVGPPMESSPRAAQQDHFDRRRGGDRQDTSGRRSVAHCHGGRRHDPAGPLSRLRRRYALPSVHRNLAPVTRPAAGPAWPALAGLAGRVGWAAARTGRCHARADRPGAPSTRHELATAAVRGCLPVSARNTAGACGQRCPAAHQRQRPAKARQFLARRGGQIEGSLDRPLYR